jgi:hypothetical protein
MSGSKLSSAHFNSSRAFAKFITASPTIRSLSLNIDTQLPLNSIRMLSLVLVESWDMESSGAKVKAG